MAENPCRYLVDWVSYTIIGVNDYKKGIETLGLGARDDIKWVEFPGRFMYADSMRYNGINIYYNGRVDGMGVNVELTGTGCREWESLTEHGWDYIFELMNRSCVQFTRFDVALDDHIGIIDIKRLYRDTERRNYVSQYKTCEYHVKQSEYDEITINHGRKISKSMIRIYDKAKERGIADEHWIRIEIQLRDESANGAVKYLLDNDIKNNSEAMGKLFNGLIRGDTKNRLRYIKKPKDARDTNKSRWETAPYWEQFLQDAEKIKLFEKVGREYNYKDLVKTFTNYAGVITAYIDIHGVDETIKEVYMIKSAKGRNPKYDELVEKELKRRKDYEQRIERLYGNARTDEAAQIQE